MDTIIVCERMGKARSAFRLGRDTGKGSLPGAVPTAVVARRRGA
jgi:hypothetical protein